MADKIYPDETDLQKIMAQMKEGKQYVDYDSEYYDGENRTYLYDPTEKTFKIIRIDTIALTYRFEETLTERVLMECLEEISLYRLRKSGFEV